MVLEVDQCRRPSPLSHPHPHPSPTLTPASLSPGAIARMYSCRLQIASGPSANCKRVVCKLQGCRLQFARGLGAVFQTISVSKSKSFLFSLLFYFLCKLQGFLCKLQACPLQIANVPCFLLKHSPVFPTHHPSKSCQGLAGVAKGWQWLPRVGRVAKVC